MPRLIVARLLVEICSCPVRHTRGVLLTLHAMVSMAHGHAEKHSEGEQLGLHLRANDCCMSATALRSWFSQGVTIACAKALGTKPGEEPKTRAKPTTSIPSCGWGFRLPGNDCNSDVISSATVLRMPHQGLCNAAGILPSS